jgi:hypothetical protein
MLNKWMQIFVVSYIHRSTHLKLLPAWPIFFGLLTLKYKVLLILIKHRKLWKI